MLMSVFQHPLFTFVAGILVSLCAVFFLLNSCAAPNRSSEKVALYRKSMEKVFGKGVNSRSYSRS
jgi:hypothetical protein